jgi:hypothetical protein
MPQVVQPSSMFMATARSYMSWRVRSRMYSPGVAYTSLSLARSSYVSSQRIG